MTRALHLLGPPRVVVDGEPAPPPRGRKAWALLAYLLATRVPVPRERLASLLFADADDPLGALRWNLAEARRLLGDGASLTGSPVRLTLPAGTLVDVEVLAGGSWEDALRLPGLGQELLEGLSYPGCESFETWLLSERRHVEGLAAAALQEGARVRLAAGAHDEAASLAARLVGLSPYDDAAHELLIRAYAAGGDGERASQQLAACVGTFRRELGREPAESVLAAAQVASPIAAVSRPVSGRAAALADLDAGEAAIAAGVPEAGLQALRRAVAASRACGDPGLEARAMLALAESLAWTTRGTQEEVASTLHETVVLARECGDAATAAKAVHQLAFLEMMHANYERALRWLAEAETQAGVPPEVAARLSLLRAWILTDVGRYRAADDLIDLALAAAAAVGDQELEAQCLGERARTTLMTLGAAEAREPIERSLALTRRMGRVSYLPFPLGLLGRIELAEGDPVAARQTLDHALALGVEQGDPCWQALALSGIGLVAAAEGDPDAPAICDDAVHRTGGTQLHWRWVLGWALEARAAVAVGAGDTRARAWIDELETFAGRSGMRDLLARAHLHRHDLGDDAALGAATLVAAAVESPRLATELASREARLAPGLSLRTGTALSP